MVKRLSIVIAIFFLLISVGFASSITGAMGNARMILYPEVNGWTNTIIEKSILTKNVNDVSINITLQIDQEGEKFLELIDKSFILQPHTEKKAEFIVKVKKEGTYKGKINVFFSPVDGNQKAGVALSSEIIVIAKKNQGSSGSNDGNIRDEDENTEVTTGDVVSGENEGKKSPVIGLGLLIGSVVVLLIILIFLVIVLSKKGEKRRNKVNARRKT